MRSVRGVFLVLLFCMFIGALASQSSAQTTFTFTETATGGSLGPESGNFGNVTLTLITSGTEGTATCTATDACIEVQLDATANSTWNLFNQTGAEPTVGVFAFNAPTGVSVVSCSVGTCSINAPSGGVGYDGLGTYTDTLSDTGTGSSVTGGNTITGNALTFYLQDPTSPLDSLSDIEKPPTGTTSPNPVSDFGLNVCEASGGTSSCEASTHGYAAITPEPASYLLFGTGLLGFGVILRKKRGSSGSVSV